MKATQAMQAAPVSQISLICVPTRDQERAIAFYESLGFETCVDTSFGNGYRWVEIFPPQGATGIALAPPPGPEEIAPTVTGITLTTPDIEKSHARFVELGIDVDAEVSRMGDPVPPMFWFRDPSGHTLMVVERP